MKVIYTDAAEKEMQSFHERQKHLLEELIAEKKFIYGDETLEITASDIKEASEKIRAYRPKARRYQAVLLASRVYVVIGIFIMMGAYLFPNLQSMFSENKLQGMLFVTGAALILIGITVLSFYQFTLHRYGELRNETERAEISSKEFSAVVKQSLLQPPETPPISPAALRAGLVLNKDLSGLVMKNEDLRGMELLYRKLIGADFSGSAISNGNFQGSELQGANFANADLEKTRFPNSDLRAANFRQANLKELYATSARLEGADFTSANLENADLRRAVYNDETKWPKGFNPEEHGAIKMA